MIIQLNNQPIDQHKKTRYTVVTILIGFVLMSLLHGVDCSFDEPIFESCHEALTFAFRHMNASPRTPLSDYMGGEIKGSGRGLSGLYALEVAGSVKYHVCTLMTAEKMAIIARFIQKKEIKQSEEKIDESDLKPITTKELSEFIKVSQEHIRKKLAKDGSFYGLIPIKDDKGKLVWPHNWRSFVAEKYGISTGYSKIVTESVYSKEFIEACRILANHRDIVEITDNKELRCVLVARFFGERENMKELALQLGITYRWVSEINSKIKSILDGIEERALVLISSKLKERAFF